MKQYSKLRKQKIIPTLKWTLILQKALKMLFFIVYIHIFPPNMSINNI